MGATSESFTGGSESTCGGGRDSVTWAGELSGAGAESVGSSTRSSVGGVAGGQTEKPIATRTSAAVAPIQRQTHGIWLRDLHRHRVTDGAKRQDGLRGDVLPAGRYCQPQAIATRLQ